MKMKVVSGIALALFAVSMVPLCGAEVQSPGRQRTPKEIATTSSHERALAALRAERLKLEAGKSTLFNVCQVARDLRTVELQMGTNSTQRLAAHQRHIAMLQNLKDETDRRIETGVVAPLEGKLVAQQLKEAEADLLRAKRGTE